MQTGDAALAQRAWAEFYGSNGCTESSPWQTEKPTGPAALVEGGEASWVSTNDTALYGLADIENLALLGDRMPGWPSWGSAVARAAALVGTVWCAPPRGA